MGDDLAPNYVHYFNQKEIAAELNESGFVLQYYRTSLMATPSEWPLVCETAMLRK
ncbi:MAG: hypothetical protein WKF84_20565 [Pyrinomonadaceae bacterium]